MRLLRLRIQEPLHGRVMPSIAISHGENEACRRYRALVLTTLRQLAGLRDTTIQIDADPEDAAEAIRFWILPCLADTWQATDDGSYVSTHWRIRFAPPAQAPLVHADGEILCPWLGSRLLHTALLGLESGDRQCIGRSDTGQVYLHARSATAHVDSVIHERPPMPIIHSDGDWLEALDSPLGPALKKAYEACE